MRQYEIIWNKLKNLPAEQAEGEGVSVTASRPLHARILKAVKKEKWFDIGYKILLNDKRAVLTHTRSHSIITFYLTVTIGIEDI